MVRQVVYPIAGNLPARWFLSRIPQHRTASSISPRLVTSPGVWAAGARHRFAEK